MNETGTKAGIISIEALIQPGTSPLFQETKRLEYNSAWFGHIPFAYWLVAALEPSVLVELGVDEGVSYAAFCGAVRAAGLPTRCFAVDNWLGAKHKGGLGDALFEDLARFNQDHYSGVSEILRLSFDDALGYFADGAVDLLHIDGKHAYEAVRYDFESWQPKLSDRAVVLFHDSSDRQGNFGVWRLWAELSAQYPGFEFTHSHGLGVLCVGRNVSAPVRALCTDFAAPERAAAVRARFEWLGARYECQAQNAALQRALADQAGQLRALQAALAERANPLALPREA